MFTYVHSENWMLEREREREIYGLFFMISIYPAMDLSFLLSIHLISSIHQSSIDLHTSYSPINGHICVLSTNIYIYTSNHPWSTFIFNFPSHGQVGPLLLWRHWAGRPGQTHQKRFPMKVARKLTYGTGGKGPFQEEMSKFHIPTRNFSKALKVTFSGGVRDKKKRVTRRKKARRSQVKRNF